MIGKKPKLAAPTTTLRLPQSTTSTNTHTPNTNLVVKVEEVRHGNALDAQLLLRLPVRVLLVRLARLRFWGGWWGLCCVMKEGRMQACVRIYTCMHAWVRIGRGTGRRMRDSLPFQYLDDAAGHHLEEPGAVVLDRRPLLHIELAPVFMGVGVMFDLDGMTALLCGPSTSWCCVCALDGSGWGVSERRTWSSWRRCRWSGAAACPAAVKGWCECEWAMGGQDECRIG